MNTIIKSIPDMPLSYNDIRQLILETLGERPEGTQVRVNNQQNYELALLDYVQQISNTMATSLVGVANVDTEPIEPPTARIFYVFTLQGPGTFTFKKFVDADLNPITVSVSKNKAVFGMLFWDTQNWSVSTIEFSSYEGAGSGYFIDLTKEDYQGISLIAIPEYLNGNTQSIVIKTASSYYQLTGINSIDDDSLLLSVNGIISTLNSESNLTELKCSNFIFDRQTGVITATDNSVILSKIVTGSNIIDDINKEGYEPNVNDIPSVVAIKKMMSDLLVCSKTVRGIEIVGEGEAPLKNDNVMYIEIVKSN